MSAVTCARVTDVEAARDGRLGGAELESFARHLPTCGDCRDESRKLDALAELLKGTATPERDELAGRRRRKQLLRDADRQVVTERATPNRARSFAALAIAAVLLLFVGRMVIARRPPVPSPPVAVNQAEFAAIVAAEGTRYTRTRDGLVERIDLAEGELAIAVRHVDGGEHVLVKLPDGELEDLGTRFVVVVQGGQTKQVVVQEGLVVLRLRGREPVHLAAGGSWVRDVVAVAPSAPASACAPIAVASAPAPRVLKPAPSAEVADVVGAEHKAAMAAYRSGDHRAAAAKLAAFVQAHPSDPRSEDASYVRIIALQRAGDAAAARVAAKEYLARYPKGFRRPEVEAISP